MEKLKNQVKELQVNQPLEITILGCDLIFWATETLLDMSGLPKGSPKGQNTDKW